MFDYLVSFLVNFVLIFGSIVLFFLPFVGVFWYRQRAQIHAANPHFNYFMEQFFVSREFNYLVAFWAALEALVWFVIPEFLLVLVIFMKIRNKFDLIKYDIIGTVAGTALGLVWYVQPEMFLRIPYVYPAMLEQVRAWYDQLGVWALVNQPFSGVPYKTFIHIAQDYSFFLPLFFLIAISARMLRYVVVYYATKALYPATHRFVRRHYAILFVFATLIFTALLMRVSQLYA